MKMENFTDISRHTKGTMRGGRESAFLLVIIALTGEGTSGLQVYNCEGPNTTYQVISMLEPESCPDPEKDYEAPRLETVQVLQSQEEAHVAAHQCLIKRTIRATRCGFTSITYGSHIVEWRNMLAITKEDCKALIETRQIKLGRKGEKRTLVIGDSGFLTTTLFTKGNLSRNGDCEHANFVSGVNITQNHTSRLRMRLQPKPSRPNTVT